LTNVFLFDRRGMPKNVVVGVFITILIQSMNGLISPNPSLGDPTPLANPTPRQNNVTNQFASYKYWPPARRRREVLRKSGKTQKWKLAPFGPPSFHVVGRPHL